MNPMILFSGRIKGITASFLLHAALLAAGGAVFMRPIEYAVEFGAGGVELSLVAAPAEEPAREPAKAESEAPLLRKERAAKQPADPAAREGDGSSPVPGQDATTFYSRGGALTEMMPDYLKNPAPAYPWEARQKGWEGVVVLKVDVDESGRAVKVETEKSSGHSVLDQSALETVRGWRFRSARLGSAPVEASVLIPVRFRLED